MKTYYPMMVNLQGKRCVVVGGGSVAERKVQGLLDGGANRVEVIAPAASSALRELAGAGSIQLVQREYREGDLQGVMLVMAATNNRQVNHEIAVLGDRLGIFVNVADLGEEGSFVTPSTVRRGELLLAVTTGGASPALAAIMKRQLARQYNECFGDYVEGLRLLRARVLSGVMNPELRTTLLRLAAEEVAEQAERNDGLVTYTENQIDEWMSRLLQAAERSK
ncbi:bifunctional precorrin-2 dehydrogenase/sirohydrochlorin ferrochelatase [Paenibacillus sp. CF384]|uniref:precorrin-2 dehydrogenase/sirohydrochlorin ferrochelatase family protein n=1 Tax=Paenibacillus sp. CF384 TaxID=1884382 RepID=UPI00089CC6B3|nr:bifunctional precorrin-2 dehydrogenase/sirohydrochlorin ferrochelatase [Paenibacillus sp. CF384]SDX40175.1 precorrin-2 dehydrogenase / sirohydrochlorin ferrochelatase [Paenibacillus sp. CF384]